MQETRRWSGLALSGLIGAIIGAAALWVALRDADPAAIWASLTRAGWATLLAGAAIHLLVMLLYAVRWRILLLSPSTMGLRRTVGLVGLGYLANYTLPGRPGELARAALARTIGTIPLTIALGSLLLEKLLDGASILLAALAAGVGSGGAPEWLRAAALLGALAFGVGAFGLLVASALGRRIAGLGHGGALGFAAARLVELTVPLHTLPRGRSLAMLVLLGGLIFLSIGAHLAVLCLGVGLAAQPAAWLLLYGALGLASVVPGPPGYVGTYQLAAVLALGVFDVQSEVAIAVATLYQLSRLGGALVVGAWAAAREGPPILRLVLRRRSTD